MKARDARKVFKSLSGDQKRFVADPRASATMSVDDWLAFLAPVAAAGAARDSVHGLGKLHRPKDVADELRDCVVPLLRILKEESGGRSPLAMTLDLSGPERPEKQLGPSAKLQPYRHDIISADQTVFWDPWLVADTRLGDGAVLHFHVATLSRKRDVKKRGSSGKIKWKTKRKVRTVTEVRVGADTDELVLVQAPAAMQAGDKIKVKSAESKVAVRLRSGVVGATPRTKLAELLRLVGDAHNQFAPAQAAEGGAP